MQVYPLPSQTSNSESDMFKNYLIKRKFEKATKFMLKRSEYTIDELFLVDDMIDVFTAYRERNLTKIDLQFNLDQFYEAFRKGNQTDFFRCIDLDSDDLTEGEIDLLKDIYMYMPPALQRMVEHVV